MSLPAPQEPSQAPCRSGAVTADEPSAKHPKPSDIISTAEEGRADGYQWIRTVRRDGIVRERRTVRTSEAIAVVAQMVAQRALFDVLRKMNPRGFPIL